MNRVLEVRPGEGLTLHLRYADGATLHLDASGLLAGEPGVFAPLRSRAFFEGVRVGPRGRTVTWPGELDLDVDALRLPPERSGSWFRVLSFTSPGPGDGAPSGDPTTPGPLEGGWGRAAAQEVPMPDLFVGLRYTREAWRGAVVPTGETFAEDDSPEGALRLAQRVGELRPAAVLVQAANRGELPVVIALLERGVRVRVASKEQVRAFAATAEPGLPDATTLARIAGQVRCLGEGLNTPEEDDERVRVPLARRRQVLEMRAQEEGRLREAEYAPISEDLERHVAFLDRQAERVGELLLSLVRAVVERTTLCDRTAK